MDEYLIRLVAFLYTGARRRFLYVLVGHSQAPLWVDWVAVLSLCLSRM